MEKFPIYSADLIQVLDEEYPQRCVGRSETIEEAQRYAGKRELIDELISLVQEMEENDQATS